MSDNPLKPLDDEQIEGVAGGYLFDAYELEDGYTLLWKPYQVIDNKGDVVGRFGSTADAQKFAEKNGYSTTWINWDQLQKLRETGSLS